ncbi:MAG: tetratricopeptide repeat protein [Pseudomonadota bacterium]
MRLPLVIFVLCAALCLTPSPVRAEEDPPASRPPSASARPSGMPSLEEYENIPPGVLLPDVYTLLRKKDMDSSDNISTDMMGSMTLEEVVAAYHKGKYELAAKYLLLLSESGSHQVEEILGIMYLNGQGVPKDAKDAYYWFSKAAEAGRPLAEHYLGILTFTGVGIQTDPVKALMWLNIAILHYPTGPGKKQAMEDRANISARLTRRDRDRALELTKDRLYEKGEKLLFDVELNR